MPADVLQFIGVVGADIENGGIPFRREGIQPHGKQRHAPRAARPFEQAGGVGVVAGGRIRIDITHMGCVIVVMSLSRMPVDGVFRDHATVQPVQYFLGVGAQFDAEVIDKMQRAAVIHLREDRHLCKGRPPLHQRAAGIVADPAKDRRPDA